MVCGGRGAKAEQKGTLERVKVGGGAGGEAFFCLTL